jgi:hypothetical protein
MGTKKRRRNMITVVFTMGRHHLVHWDHLLTVLAENYGKGVARERVEPEIDVLVDPKDGRAKLAAKLPDKTEWVLGEDDFIFDSLIDCAILLSYEVRGARSTLQAPEPRDPLETKYEEMQQLLGEEP